WSTTVPTALSIPRFRSMGLIPAATCFRPPWTMAFFFQAEDGIRDFHVTGVQTCALPISASAAITQNTGVSPPASALDSRSRWPRSEERRVGKECRYRRAPGDWIKKGIEMVDDSFEGAVDHAVQLHGVGRGEHVFQEPLG